MRVHAVAFAKDTGIKLEHMLAAQLEPGYTSIEEALDAAQQLRMPEALVTAFEEQLREQERAAKLAAQEFLKKRIATIATYAELKKFEASDDGFHILFDDDLKKLFIARELELASNWEQVSAVGWPSAWNAKEFDRIKSEKQEAFALADVKKARSFKNIWALCQRFHRSDAPSTKLAWEKLKKAAKTKEQLKIVCERLAPYDPRDHEHPDLDATAHPPSEKYLFFVKQLAKFYPLPDA